MENRGCTVLAMDCALAGVEWACASAAAQSLDCLKRRRREGFRCECCGEWHVGAPTDFGFQLPDDAWSMPREQRPARLNAERRLSCAIDMERNGSSSAVWRESRSSRRKGYFAWGLWAEVSKRDFFRYHDGELKPESENHSRVVSRTHLPRISVNFFGKEVGITPMQGGLRPTLEFPCVRRGTDWRTNNELAFPQPGTTK